MCWIWHAMFTQELVLSAENIEGAARQGAAQGEEA